MLLMPLGPFLLSPLLSTPLLTPKCLLMDDSPYGNIPRIFPVDVSHNHNASMTVVVTEGDCWQYQAN